MTKWKVPTDRLNVDPKHRLSNLPSAFVRLPPQYAAVIEAAKAFVEANNFVDGDEWSTYHALETAVEALQEVENETDC